MPASSGPMVASVADSCDCAREVSSSVPRPASRRAWVRARVSFWFSTLRLCDRQLALLAAQLEVGARHLGADRDLRVAQRGRGALHLRALRLDVAAHAAEQVELPGRVEAGVVEARAERGARGAVHLREALLGVAAGGGDRRREVKLRLAPQRPCLDQVTERDAQVVVGEQRIVDQLVERRIAELRPELRLRLVRAVGGIAGPGERGRHGRGGLDVVGADRATRPVRRRRRAARSRRTARRWPRRV